MIVSYVTDVIVILCIKGGGTFFINIYTPRQEVGKQKSVTSITKAGIQRDIGAQQLGFTVIRLHALNYTTVLKTLNEIMK